MKSRLSEKQSDKQLMYDDTSRFKKKLVNLKEDPIEKINRKSLKTFNKTVDNRSNI